ncbi:hypothetical protein QFC20_003074 [Naganishia adeliensis]|uniref:Uncharacterized protein n=1 Tax=Naganishia adeliensis TaxID=92952 RepID=A0ACC2WF86_9TREE|nr:hypothetical protein QFC20_003074 [Naganishia adeliensis]
MAREPQIIFAAYRDPSILNQDWDSIDPVERLETLKRHAARTTITIPTPTFPLPKPTVQVQNQTLYNRIGAVNGHTGDAGPNDDGWFEDKVGNKRKNKSSDTKAAVAVSKKQKASYAAFPSAYTFETSEEDEAKRRRAQRFEREREIEESKNANQLKGFIPRQVAGHASVGGALDVTAGADGGGAVRVSQMGTGRSAGKWLGGRLGATDTAVDPNVINWDQYTIRGTSTNIEKRYLRLTSEPDPATIRPLPILRQTLEHLKKKWRAEHNYAYICDQFKSLRQDLTVQRIKNEFTVNVYEIHARMALEASDLGEYNQCQSMLLMLYEHNLPGHPDEFLAYRILYMLHTRNKSELGRTIGHLSKVEKETAPVKHALAVQNALATGNYHRFFKLYETAPNMGAYLMDHFVTRERMFALTMMSKAYMTLPLAHIQAELAFENLEQTNQFLEEHQAANYVKPAQPDAFPALSSAVAQSGLSKKQQRAILAQQQKPAAIPLEGRVWDCRASHAACESGNDRYRTVDLKGQI